MPTRLVCIFIALSFFGYTVVPAAWLPCCCKNRKAASACEMDKPSCCSGPKQIAEVHNEDLVGKCCSPTQESVECSAAADTIAQKCPKCRCIEQMRISTGLSGQSLNEDSFRLLPLGHSELCSDLIESFRNRPSGI